MNIFHLRQIAAANEQTMDVFCMLAFDFRLGLKCGVETGFKANHDSKHLARESARANANIVRNACYKMK